MYYIFQKIGDNYHQTVPIYIKNFITERFFSNTNNKLNFFDKPLYCLLITSQRIQTNKSWTDLKVYCMKKDIQPFSHIKVLLKFQCYHFHDGGYSWNFGYVTTFKLGKFLIFFRGPDVFILFLCILLSQKQYHSGQKIGLLHVNSNDKAVAIFSYMMGP